MNRPRSSRQRYRLFVKDYRNRRLDDHAGASESQKEAEGTAKGHPRRREHLRGYLRWLWPHRYALGALLVLALISAGLEMAEPLFMRFIVDRVLLNKTLDSVERFVRLNLAGALFLALIVASNLIG